MSINSNEVLADLRKPKCPLEVRQQPHFHHLNNYWVDCCAGQTVHLYSEMTQQLPDESAHHVLRTVTQTMIVYLVQSLGQNCNIHPVL